MHKKRINGIIKKLEEKNIDALLITKPENIFYLTSFSADKVILVVTKKGLFAVTDFIYQEKAIKFFKGYKVYITKDSFPQTIAGAVKKHKIKNLGFESLDLSFNHYKHLKRELKRVRLLPCEGIVELLRVIKENSEILAIKNALKVTGKIFRGVKKRLNPHSTELSISRYIKEAFIREGVEGYSFEPIVATQPFSSEPHYRPTKKKLGHNKAVLIDMGARLNGYNSDLTRMCFLGKISSKFVRLYNILYDAQKRAIERIRPGVKISSIDLAARQYIDSKGLRKFFGHALGHGVGLEIHEKPTISYNNNGLLREGMVFTVEPGIYIPGFGGLRIEDMVCVRKKGCEVLSDDINKSI